MGLFGFLPPRVAPFPSQLFDFLLVSSFLPFFCKDINSNARFDLRPKPFGRWRLMQPTSPLLVTLSHLAFFFLRCYYHNPKTCPP